MFSKQRLRPKNFQQKKLATKQSLITWPKTKLIGLTQKHWFNPLTNWKPWFDPKLKQNKQLNQKHKIFLKNKSNNKNIKNTMNFQIVTQKAQITNQTSFHAINDNVLSVIMRKSRIKHSFSSINTQKPRLIKICLGSWKNLIICINICYWCILTLDYLLKMGVNTDKNFHW
jgi:hypothetical protein